MTRQLDNQHEAMPDKIPVWLFLPTPKRARRAGLDDPTHTATVITQ